MLWHHRAAKDLCDESTDISWDVLYLVYQRYLRSCHPCCPVVLQWLKRECIASLGCQSRHRRGRNVATNTINYAKNETHKCLTSFAFLKLQLSVSKQTVGSYQGIEKKNQQKQKCERDLKWHWIVTVDNQQKMTQSNAYVGFEDSDSKQELVASKILK